MKVYLKGIKKLHNVEQKVVLDFVKFLQKETPLNKDIFIHFLEKRNIPMTTGVRIPHHQIFVLTKNRLLIDILRTLSHEWIHEFQHQKMGVSDSEPTQDIGGPEENMANMISGIFIKLFEKKFPQYSQELYGEN
jgi:hypothetical protein